MSVATSSPREGLEEDLELAAVGRWILGHQAFHLQLVAMLSVLDRCREGLELDDRPLLSRSLADLRRLFDASTANMVYTASFSPDLYAEVVRPTMMPPYLSPGFSGQLSHEHHLLLAELKRLRAALEGRWGGDEPWPVDVAEAWRQIGEAIRRNRNNHGLVCQRFIPDGSSLLTEFLTARVRSEEQPLAGE
ncbi:MAG TPA: hypothetical protein VFE33_14510 [Thermoanaerobaculia bacterium]|nr:hypothetical protein [Thermoanaerobaculia bacterium]